MWLYLDGSESGVRLKQRLLEDKYLILIDLNQNTDDYAKRRLIQASGSALTPTTLYITQEINYNTVCITQLLRSLET